MDLPLANHFNSLKFLNTLRKNRLTNQDPENQDNQDNFNELFEIASKERGVLYKILQIIFPEKISKVIVKNNPLSKQEVIQIINSELKINFDEHFSELSEALFCASIAQVHKAKLIKEPFKGREVAVKIQYPSVKKTIDSQLKLLKLASKAANFTKMAKWNISLDSHLFQIEKRLIEELDYGHELKNMQKSQGPPYPIDSYCTPLILVQSWINGDDLNFVINNWNNIQKKNAAELILTNYFTQVFVNGFFQGDTNFSNFIFEDNKSEIKVSWIDFGNWCELPINVQQSLSLLIFKAIQNEDSNYLGHFERIGFDLKKIECFQNVLPLLLSILFEPFITDRPFDLSKWNLEEQIDNLLGENKWWFRSGGNSIFLELIKSFYGVVDIIKHLGVNVNWQRIFQSVVPILDFEEINKTIPIYKNNIPLNSNCAKKLVVQILKNKIEHVKIELPAITFLDLENIVPEDIKQKLIDKSLDIKKIKRDYLDEGLRPGEVFSLSDTDKNVETLFLIYLI